MLSQWASSASIYLVGTCRFSSVLLPTKGYAFSSTFLRARFGIQVRWISGGGTVSRTLGGDPHLLAQRKGRLHGRVGWNERPRDPRRCSMLPRPAPVCTLV